LVRPSPFSRGTTELRRRTPNVLPNELVGGRSTGMPNGRLAAPYWFQNQPW
jgi:hypothetical protein